MSLGIGYNNGESVGWGGVGRLWAVGVGEGREYILKGLIKYADFFSD